MQLLFPNLYESLKCFLFGVAGECTRLIRPAAERFVNVAIFVRRTLGLSNCRSSVRRPCTECYLKREKEGESV